MMTRRGLITGALATLLAPLDLEPRRRFWPGWTPPPGLNLDATMTAMNPFYEIQARVVRALEGFIGSPNTVDVRREIARRAAVLLGELGGQHHLAITTRDGNICVLPNGIDHIISIELVREITL